MEIKKSNVCKSMLKEHRSLNKGNTAWVKTIGDAGLLDQTHEGSQPYQGGPGPAVHPSTPKYLPSFLSSPFSPSPSLLTLTYHCLLVLWTSSPPHPKVSGSPSVAGAAPAHVAAPGALQSRTAHTCSAAPPPRWDPAGWINKQITVQTHSCAPKGNDQCMLLLNLS